MNNTKDHPAILLNKDSYQWIAVQMKPQYLSTIFKPCCYTAENSYKVYKWKPDDPKYRKTDGEVGKKIMKIREKSHVCLRCCCLPSRRHYVGYCQAEYNQQIVFTLDRPYKCSLLWFQRPTVKVNILD